MKTLVLVSALLLSQTVSKQVTVNAWLPDSLIASMQAQGVVFDGGGHYQVLSGRFTYWASDAGLVSAPLWPGAVILSQAAPTLCSSSFVCNWDNSGGLDVAVAASSGCFCSNGSGTCLATNPQGVTGQVLPNATTAGPGYSWTNPSGAGCVPLYSCVALFVSFPDGGKDSPWPAACPGGS